MKNSTVDKFTILMIALAIVLTGAVAPSHSSSNPTLWHLDVLDDSRFVQDNKFSPRFGKDIQGNFISLNNLQTQSPIVIYVVDSGVNPNVENLKGVKFESVDLTADAGTQQEGLDCNNHGTAVASTIIGKRGVVPSGYDVSLVSVKLIACSEEFGANSHIGRALEWIWLNHDRTKRGIVNISMSTENATQFSQSESLTKKGIDSLRLQGITVVVAAGNRKLDACSVYPAGVDTALTVGSLSYSQINRNRARIAPSRFSNYGECVDVWSFGERISMPNNEGKIRRWQGTSLAAPIVSGMLVRYALQYNTSILTAEALLLENTKEYKEASKYGDILVPFFKKPGEVVESRFNKDLKGNIAQFGPTELAVQVNQFLDIRNLRIEYYENGVLANSIVDFGYAEGYYPDTISVKLSSPYSSPSVKIFDASGAEEVYLGEIKVLPQEG
jgi:hypothetical protein